MTTAHLRLMCVHQMVLDLFASPAGCSLTGLLLEPGWRNILHIIFLLVMYPDGWGPMDTFHFFKKKTSSGFFVIKIKV